MSETLRPATGRVARSAAVRQAARRTRLLSAGLQLFGTSGWNAGSVERICLSAGVATRAFYEEFANREALLLAVYAAILEGATSAVRAAVAGAPLVLEDRVRAGLSGYVEYLTRDPRRARVAHVELRAAGSSLEASRREAVVGFADLIEREGRLLAHAEQRRLEAGSLTALALAGAVNELLVHWATDPCPPPPEAIIEELVTVFVRVLS